MVVWLWTTSMSRKISTFPTDLLSSTPAFPLHTFFECPAGSENGSWLSLDHAWVWIIMFLSQVTSKTKDPSNTLFWKIRFLKRQLTKKPQSRHPDLDQCSTVRMLMTIRMKPRPGSLLRSGFPRAGAWQPPTRYLGEQIFVQQLCEEKSFKCNFNDKNPSSWELGKN